MPPRWTFFLDEDLSSKRLAARLRDCGFDLSLATDRFPRGTPDTEWLAEVGRQGWAAITKNDAIRYDRHETAAYEEAGVALFVLTRGNLTVDQMADIIIKAKPAMERLLERRESSLFARLHRDGSVVPMNVGRRAK